MADFIKIAITAPVPRDCESERITRLLELGWNRVHLRYPSLTLTQVRKIVELVPQKWHDRLRLHGHFELINEFNIGGLHLNSRCPAVPSGFRGAISKSCHTVDEVRQASAGGRFDSVTLSPVFPSVSKPGYNPVLTKEYMRVAASMMPVIALGGVTPRRIALLKQLGFAGCAVLGAISEADTLDEIAAVTEDFNQNII